MEEWAKEKREGGETLVEARGWSVTPIHVVGMGMDGVVGLTDSVQKIVQQARALVGSDRLLTHFPNHPAEKIPLKDIHQTCEILRQTIANPVLSSPSPPSPLSPSPSPQAPQGQTASPTPIVILTSGDPPFLGLGRFLPPQFPPEQLTFHPHLSSVQLAFSRVKLPWQDAEIISAHGRSLDELRAALQRGTEKIAILTDATNTPGAIARLVNSLDLPSFYQIWVCENLGGTEERITRFVPRAIPQAIPQGDSLAMHEICDRTFASLNVVILHRQSELEQGLDLSALPALGLPDSAFLSFPDRPGLMTKREVRTLILGELGLQPGQTIWDIGAGTGSVSIEIARLFPQCKIYAVEKTAMGVTLIQGNCQRFQIQNIHPIYGDAPTALTNLPSPDRIFIGGSGGRLDQILTVCADCLHPGGRIVLATTTLEHFNLVLTWVEQQKKGVDAPDIPPSTTDQNRLPVSPHSPFPHPLSPRSWNCRQLQVQLSRSVPIGPLTRFAPLNPITLVILQDGSDKDKNGA